IFKKKQKYFLIVLSLLSVILSQLINEQIKEVLDKIVTQMNIWIFYGYIPVLLVLFTLLKRGKQNG
ncbi:hypothetical protein, partial [Neobacillus drentensis]